MKPVVSAIAVGRQVATLRSVEVSLAPRWLSPIVEHPRQLAARGKTRQKVQVAMARELAAFVWEVMRLTTPLPQGAPPFQRRERATPATRPAKERIYRLKIK